MKGKRVQVILNDEFVEKLDEYAGKIGMSRSALCALFIGQGLMAYNAGMDLITKYGEEAIKRLDEKRNDTNAV